MQELLDKRGKQLGLLVDQAAQRPSPTGRKTPLVRVDLRESSVMDAPPLAPGGAAAGGHIIHEDEPYMVNGR